MMLETMRAQVWSATKGHFGRWLGIGLVAAAAAVPIFVIGLVPAWRSLALLMLLADLLLLGLLILAALVRLVGKVMDMAANLSLQHHLRQVGFSSRDFFVDGAAASPTLQLLLVKILEICRPASILELGSGQTTKVLAHFGKQHPNVEIFTIEEDAEWHRLVQAGVEIPSNHSYRTSPTAPVELALPVGERITTVWYRDGADWLKGRQFELILIDGPNNARKGGEFERYARCGILPHLPAILADRYAIVLDDTDNFGYVQTARAIEAVLAKSGRKFTTFGVDGVKSQTVICSTEWGFLRSV